MKYLPYLGLLFGFAGSAYYAIRVESIRDRDLRRTERAFGRDSWVFRFSERIMNNRSYVISARIGGALAALGFLTGFICMIVFP